MRKMEEKSSRKTRRSSLFWTKDFVKKRWPLGVPWSRGTCTTPGQVSQKVSFDVIMSWKCSAQWEAILWCDYPHVRCGIHASQTSRQRAFTCNCSTWNLVESFIRATFNRDETSKQWCSKVMKRSEMVCGSISLWFFRSVCVCVCQDPFNMIQHVP